MGDLCEKGLICRYMNDQAAITAHKNNQPADNLDTIPYQNITLIQTYCLANACRIK